MRLRETIVHTAVIKYMFDYRNVSDLIVFYNRLIYDIYFN